jgi:hypothetical protein
MSQQINASNPAVLETIALLVVCRSCDDNVINFTNSLACLFASVPVLWLEESYSAAVVIGKILSLLVCAALPRTTFLDDPKKHRSRFKHSLCASSKHESSEIRADSRRFMKRHPNICTAMNSAPKTTAVNAINPM